MIAGENYGQGSSREHAALAPRYLGLRVVIAKSIARIHRQNLVNFGIIPLLFSDPANYDALEPGCQLGTENLQSIEPGKPIAIQDRTQKRNFHVRHDLSSRQIEILQE